MFTLRLFGGLTLESPADDIGRAGQKRRLALLAVLALRPGGRMSRDKLLGMFWSESTEEEGRHRLSSALYDIRKALGDEVVATRGDDVALATNLVATDVAAFEHLVAKGEWQAALAIYRGPFLDGIYIDGPGEFEHWADTKRAELGRLYEKCLEETARLAAAAGDSAGAVNAWHRLADVQPLSGRIVIALMRAMDAAGNRAGAIQRAEIHAARLRSELGASPDAAVAALATEMKRVDATSVIVAPPDLATANPIVRPKVPRLDPAPPRRAPRLVLAALALVVAIPLVSWAISQRSAAMSVGSMERNTTVTMSPAAQVAWQEGRTHADAGRFDAAVEAFQRATRLDSTAALAYHHTALAMLWADAPGTSLASLEQRALELSSSLPAYERMLVRAYAAWRTADETAEALARRATLERPDHPDGWIQLGEVLFHYNPVLGRDIAHARNPFERALAIDSTSHAALWHLSLLALHDNRDADFFRLTDRVLANGPDAARRREVETLRTIVRGDSVATRRAIHALREADENILVEIASRAAVFARNLDAAESIYRLLSAPERSPYARRIGSTNLLYLSLARGRVDDAIAGLPGLERLGDQNDRDQVITFIVGFGMLPEGDPREPELIRQVLDVDRHARPQALRVNVAHMRIAIGDTVGIRASLAAMRNTNPAPDSASLKQFNGIEAHLDFRAGKLEQAMTQLQVGYRVHWFGLAGLEPGLASPFERWLMAELLEQLGRPAEADSWLAGFLQHSPGDLALREVVARRRALLARVGR